MKNTFERQSRVCNNNLNTKTAGHFRLLLSTLPQSLLQRNTMLPQPSKPTRLRLRPRPRIMDPLGKKSVFRSPLRSRQSKRPTLYLHPRLDLVSQLLTLADFQPLMRLLDSSQSTPHLKQLSNMKRIVAQWHLTQMVSNRLRTTFSRQTTYRARHRVLPPPI